MIKIKKKNKNNIKQIISYNIEYRNVKQNKKFRRKYKSFIQC